MTKGSTIRRKKLYEEVFDAQSLNTLYADTKANLDSRWNKDWKTLCIGRDVLVKFVANHLERHLSYETFRNLVAVAIQQSGRLHPDITTVMAQVTR